MPTDAPYLRITIGGLQRHVSGLGSNVEKSARFGFPPEFNLENIRTGQVDFQILADLLREHPGEIGELLNSFLAGDGTDVERCVKRLNLREADFQERGGGIFWAVVIVGVLCCASEAY